MSGRLAVDLPAMAVGPHLASGDNDFFQAVVAQVLADHATLGLDAEEHPAAAAVQRAAEGPRRFATLALLRGSSARIHHQAPQAGI